MEVIGHSTKSKQHPWLRSLGLADAVDEDAWVPVARAFDVDEAMSAQSAQASRLVGLLEAAGIVAEQRAYEFDTAQIGQFGARSGSMVTRIAVVVHSRDIIRATAIAVQLKEALAREQQERDRTLAISDAELTRLAMEAGPPPD